MSSFLLDVNVLVALSWPGHRFHDRTQRWFARNSGKGWATCPLTQAGFVRIVSNPAFSQRAVTPRDAIRALQITVRHPRHEFWKDDLNLAEAVSAFEDRLVGHQQITDAYLLGLAMHKKGKLATLDRSMGGLLPPESSARNSVEFIG
jgi:uncharacterized protein